MATDNRFGIDRASALVASFAVLMPRTAATILLTIVSRLFAAAVIIVFAFAIVAIACFLGKCRTAPILRAQQPNLVKDYI